jgi:hypothetical protein
MKDSLSFASAMALFAFMCMGAFVLQPEPQRDRQALMACLKLHPQRYCHITYNGLEP